MEEQKNENLPEEVQAENSTEEDNGEQEKGFRKTDTTLGTGRNLSSVYRI